MIRVRVRGSTRRYTTARMTRTHGDRDATAKKEPARRGTNREYEACSAPTLETAARPAEFDQYRVSWNNAKENVLHMRELGDFRWGLHEVVGGGGCMVDSPDHAIQSQ